MFDGRLIAQPVSTHSRPKAAGAVMAMAMGLLPVSTHSRPKAAGAFSDSQRGHQVGFNTQPPEGGWGCVRDGGGQGGGFQHTAARRRLGVLPRLTAAVLVVSTHSRPKAAGASLKSLAPSGFVAPISLSS